MGTCGAINLNGYKEIKESWEFHSEIHHDNINFGQLKGFVFITEDNFKNKIQIKGTFKKKFEEHFCFNGIESSKSNDAKSVSYIIESGNKKKFHFPKEIIMTKISNKNAKIIADIFYETFPLKLNLLLYLPKQKIEKSKIVVNNYQYSLLKLKNPIDIIINSTFGMKNLTNTCYINSSFQILIHIRQFVEIIRKNKDFEGNVIGNINCIFDKILSNHKNYNKSINPSTFVYNFKKEHKEYDNYCQKDSQMFLEELIWDINTKLSILDDERILYYYDLTIEKEKLFYDYMKEIDKDSYYKIYDLFYVCFIHEKKCESCGHLSYYFDDSTGLKLNFKMTEEKDYTIDLYALIMNNFKEPERIESSFPCQGCKNCFYVKEKTRIAKLPKILILSLQKTNIHNTKINPWIVKYDKELSWIKEIIDFDLYKQGNYIYEIYAINNHAGYSPKSGHYYSTIYLEELKSWFSFNDESVYPISEVEPNLYNYILFYKQKNS
jgi:ubiquitin C-terminal hydrolase